jgi:hypothetical protein
MDNSKKTRFSDPKRLFWGVLQNWQAIRYTKCGTAIGFTKAVIEPGWAVCHTATERVGCEYLDETSCTFTR